MSECPKVPCANAVMFPAVSEGGNTNSPSLTSKKKRITASKRWCFTLNNYTDSCIDLLTLKSDLYSKAIIGKEVGESGTPHLQGYIEFKTRRRPMETFKNAGDLGKRIHWEKAKGSADANYKYCSKDGDVVCCIGFPKPLDNPMAGLTWYKWQEDILATIKTKPDSRTIHWLWDLKGGVGKTTFCKYLTIYHDAILLGGKAADVRNGIVQYKAKHNGCTPSIVLVNIPRSFKKKYVSYEAFENVKDMCFYSGKYEGDMVVGNCPHLIIFANQPPDYERMSADRWAVRDITPGGFLDNGESDDDDKPDELDGYYTSDDTTNKASFWTTKPNSGCS